MSTDPRTPAEVADWLTEKATDAKGVAFDRYPRERWARTADEAAQLRLLVEQAAEHLRQFDIERTRNLAEIRRLTGTAEVLELGHKAVAQIYDRRIAALRPEGATNA